MARIYVASSWKNPYYDEVVARLKAEFHRVYDFRHPTHGGNGFRWTDIDENAPNWTFEQYREGLNHPKAKRQFQDDWDALDWADTCVLVLPCGRSAHTEAGWMAGQGKRVIVYIPEMQEPELMYKLFDKVVGSLDELVQALKPEPEKTMANAEFDLLREEMSDDDLRVVGAYGAIRRGIPKADALAQYGITEKFYEMNIERVLNS